MNIIYLELYLASLLLFPLFLYISTVVSIRHEWSNIYEKRGIEHILLVALWLTPALNIAVAANLFFRVMMEYRQRKRKEKREARDKER